MFARQVTAGLRRRGVDVITTYEDGAHQMAATRLCSIGRPHWAAILVTQDDDLLREGSLRQQQGIPFAGVIYAHQLGISIGQFVTDLDLIAAVYDPPDVGESGDLLAALVRRACDVRRTATQGVWSCTPRLMPPSPRRGRCAWPAAAAAASRSTATPSSSVTLRPTSCSPPPRPTNGRSPRDFCPFQQGNLCTAREPRPLGCRVYYCDPAYQETGGRISEEYLRRLKRLADEHGVPAGATPRCTPSSMTRTHRRAVENARGVRYSSGMTWEEPHALDSVAPRPARLGVVDPGRRLAAVARPDARRRLPEKVAPWKDAPKVVWHQPVGEGNSSPIVAGGRVFLHSKIKDKDEEEVLRPRRRRRQGGLAQDLCPRRLQELLRQRPAPRPRSPTASSTPTASPAC